MKRIEVLRNALGCAIEELERREPLGADPLTVAVIRDGRAILAETSVFLCAGCAVREPFEHRCHSPGSRCDCDLCEGKVCGCAECLEDVGGRHP